MQVLQIYSSPLRTNIINFPNPAKKSNSEIRQSDKNFVSIYNTKGLINRTSNVSFKQLITSGQDIYSLTSTPEKAEEFIKQVTSDPQNAKNVMSSLVLKHGIINVAKWYLDTKGYYGAYEKYMDKVYNTSGSLDDLIKYQPNWAPWKLEERAWILDNHAQNCSQDEIRSRFEEYSNWNREYPFVLGDLPQGFGSKEEYRELVNTLKTQDVTDKFFPRFHVKRLKGGELNDKFIYLVSFPDDKKYILKCDRTNIEDANSVDGRLLSTYEKRSIRKNKCLAADSIYSNACMNRYLELNGCDSVPHLEFYDHSSHSALYQFVEDASGDKFQQDLLDEEYMGVDEMNSQHKGLANLGIFLNDSALKNSLVDKNGKAKVIDLGHSSFVQPFKVGVKKYNIEFSNINGPDISSIYASLIMNDVN